MLEISNDLNRVLRNFIKEYQTLRLFFVVSLARYLVRLETKDPDFRQAGHQDGAEEGQHGKEPGYEGSRVPPKPETHAAFGLEPPLVHFRSVAGSRVAEARVGPDAAVV